MDWVGVWMAGCLLRFALWCLRVNPARRAHVDTESGGLSATAHSRTAMVVWAGDLPQTE